MIAQIIQQQSRFAASLTPEPFGDLDYVLSSQRRASAAVFKHNGTDDILVAHLFSGDTKNAGSHSLENLWDGKDYSGNETPNGPYKIKLLINNVLYGWINVLGNTSDVLYGPTTHHSTDAISGMTVEGDYAYYVCGYNEGHFPHLKFNLSTPNSKINVLPTYGGTLNFICSDASKIYYGIDRDSVNSAIVALSIPADTQYAFSSGTGFQAHHTWYVAGLLESSPISGMAVQRTGTYIFASHKSTNQVKVYNKTTGAFIRDNSVTSPKAIAYDNTGNFIWMISGTNTVAKYPVNSDGTFGTATVTLTGITQALDIAISPTTGQIAVTDRGTSHQVKFFNPTTGALVSTLGRTENYLNERVFDDKFYFNNTKTFSENDAGTGRAYISFQPDGSFWVGDYGNMRSQHFAADHSYIGQIQATGFSYSCQADINNPTRVFNNFFEFEVDYETETWTFVKNWGWNITIPTGYDAERMKSVATLSNGRTYAIYNPQNGSGYEVTELVNGSGIRHTGIYLDFYLAMLYSDGSIWKSSTNNVGVASVWQRKPLTGFDGSNNPTWGSYVTMETSPVITNADPVSSDGFMLRDLITDNNTVVSFCQDTPSGDGRAEGWHLGGLKNNKWVFKTCYATSRAYQGSFPYDGGYDVGNSVQGSASFAQGIENFIFWGYKGEGYKGNQANRHNHFHESGLFIGQFGTDQGEVSKSVEQEAFPQMTGNSNSGTYVRNGDNLYMFQCDEGWRGGTSWWKISNLDSIEILEFDIVKSGSITLPTPDYTNLMSGLAYGTVLPNNANDYTRFPTSDGAVNKYGSPGWWKVTTNIQTYKRTERDVFAEFYPGGTLTTANVTRDLGTNTLASWSIKGDLYLNEGYDNNAGDHKGYFEILDQADKVILRVFRREVSYPSDYRLYVNSQVVITETGFNLSALCLNPQPIEITYYGSVLSFKWRDINVSNVTPIDGTANIMQPKKMRLFFESTARGFLSGFSNMKFYNH